MTDLPACFLERPFAHRGLHDRSQGVIENSRAAVAAAVETGYGVELDLQLSADGEAMVFHDDHLDRLTGETGLVRKKTAVELGRIGLTDSDEGVPTLLDILDLVRGRAPLLIEIKDQSQTLGPVDGRLERRVARVLSAYEGPCALMSFNPHSVGHCQTAAPDIPRGRVTCDFSAVDWPDVPRSTADRLIAIDDLESLGARFISHKHDDLARPAVATARAAGLPVFCWTVRSDADERTARRFADNITFEGYLA